MVMRHNRVWVLLVAAALALAACNLGISGSAGEPPGGDDGKGEELESLGGGFVWRREGGIAGFCDVVTVAAGGEATVATCRSDPPDALGSVELTGWQSAVLDDLLSRLGSFEQEQSDPGTADALLISITFSGGGDGQPTDEDIAAIEALATEVLRASAGQ